MDRARQQSCGRRSLVLHFAAAEARRILSRRRVSQVPSTKRDSLPALVPRLLQDSLASSFEVLVASILSQGKFAVDDLLLLSQRCQEAELRGSSERPLLSLARVEGRRRVLPLPSLFCLWPSLLAAVSGGVDPRSNHGGLLLRGYRKLTASFLSCQLYLFQLHDDGDLLAGLALLSTSPTVSGPILRPGNVGVAVCGSLGLG